MKYIYFIYNPNWQCNHTSKP